MMAGETGAPGPAYGLSRTDNVPLAAKPSIDESLDYSSNMGSDSYYQDGTGSSVTGLNASHANYHQDATETVHEMHLALLYLLSNPEEFKKALHAHPPRGATTLAEWNAEYEDDDESVITSATVSTPLPFVVFADDAEVVLPQAHTASQLFGLERLEGIELEAAAGIPALSTLFIRWLALMPSGDHLNIIDPPGLTVMRIAGGRYRVTAAHRVVWTWMNEFAPLTEEGGFLGEGSPEKPDSPALQVGDLVTMTIVDVFETDNQGKLLSYCPTFDNRAVYKTNQAAETLRKSSNKFFAMLGSAQRAVAKSDVNKKASAQIKKMGLMEHAKSVASNVRHRVDEAVQHYNSPSRRRSQQSQAASEKGTDLKDFEEAMTAAADEATASSPTKMNDGENGASRAEDYISDDETGEGGTAEI